MLKALQRALKVEEVRKRLLYTFLMLVLIRFGCNLPIPGVDSAYLAGFFEALDASGMGFVNAITECKPVYHIIHYYSASYNCNSEIRGNAERR